MKVKEGVNIRLASAQCLLGMHIADSVMCNEFDAELIVTEVFRDQNGSLHQKGHAFDARLVSRIRFEDDWHAEDNYTIDVRVHEALRRELTPLGFDVVTHGRLMTKHHHIEWDPKV